MTTHPTERPLEVAGSIEIRDYLRRHHLQDWNAALSGHLALWSLFVLNLVEGPLWACLAAPIGWALAQSADRGWVDERRGYLAIVALQVAAALAFVLIGRA